MRTDSFTRSFDRMRSRSLHARLSSEAAFRNFERSFISMSSRSEIVAFAFVSSFHFIKPLAQSEADQLTRKDTYAL